MATLDRKSYKINWLERRKTLVDEYKPHDGISRPFNDEANGLKNHELRKAITK